MLMGEPPSPNLVTVMFTIDSMANARTIVKLLLDKKLIACANMIEISSMYWWQSKIEEAEEVMVVLKARKDDFTLIEVEIDRLHPYEVPCIVCYDIALGNRPYLDWVLDSTER
ncbi:MAG: Divalent-cation tolerance protein CutA [Methanomassiliicoccales archaeon PtaU1.Bin124]|nr:MAG: Divalent-cation tolerance protein CutA [Methanomassiliicoccales archaeon PtaU1.Bin124]